jgi:hypothetical protein
VSARLEQRYVHNSKCARALEVRHALGGVKSMPAYGDSGDGADCDAQRVQSRPARTRRQERHRCGAPGGALHLPPVATILLSTQWRVSHVKAACSGRLRPARWTVPRGAPVSVLRPEKTALLLHATRKVRCSDTGDHTRVAPRSSGLPAPRGAVENIEEGPPAASPRTAVKASTRHATYIRAETSRTQSRLHAASVHSCRLADQPFYWTLSAVHASRSALADTATKLD